MPRTARLKSRTDIYHVILRGINRQQIFLDREDYETFIRLLHHFQGISHYELYAYCLMGNHVHLLMHTPDEPLGTIFRRLGSAFVYWYNVKYQRAGHLFQDRFKSEPVEDNGYFLTALRYILQNPVKAGICSSPADYPYSSFRDIAAGNHPPLPCTLKEQELIEFILQNRDDQCLDISDSPRRGITNTAAMELVRKEFGTSLPSLTRETRKSLELSIRRLSREGVSIRQINRLTGIPKSIIERSK